MKEKINIISLGCARNLVDSEVMSGLLQRADYGLTSEAAEADIVLINTCSFIDDAKEEAIDTILEIARLKEDGKLRTLVVAGCLPQRYSAELSKELPEVDLFIGTGEVPRIVEIIKAHKESKKKRVYVGLPRYLYDEATPRLRSTAPHTAFVKVSEGCDHKCAFCIIPQLRGPHRSRPIDSIVEETSKLAEEGVKEISLIAQDLTAYGRDRKDGTTLYGLLSDMVQVPRIQWIRLLYAYPNFLEGPLLSLIRDNDKICKYLDIPFQHVTPRLLSKMRRGKSGSAVREAIQRLRVAIPDITLRTSLIVGFPGETDKDFQELLDFVEESQFERLGVFKYSKEDGTTAALMEDQIPEEEKERRWQEVMELQAQISRTKNRALIGTVQRAIIDGLDPDTGRLMGRTQAHAPEVDGVVYMNNGLSDKGEGKIKPGEMLNVRITEALDYDLMGEMLDG